MAGREDYAQLGRAEVWLRAIGFLIWGFVGMTKLSSQGPTEPSAWLFPWAVYGAAYVAAAFHQRFPLWLARALLPLQSGAVGLMPSLGFQGLEGLLLAIVVAQMPVVFTLRQSVGLAVIQLPLLLAIVFPFNPARSVFEILGAHSAFCVFALLGYRIQQREREAALRCPRPTPSWSRPGPCWCRAVDRANGCASRASFTTAWATTWSRSAFSCSWPKSSPRNQVGDP